MLNIPVKNWKPITVDDKLSVHKLIQRGESLAMVWLWFGNAPKHPTIYLMDCLLYQSALRNACYKI